MLFSMMMTFLLRLFCAFIPFAPGLSEEVPPPIVDLIAITRKHLASAKNNFLGNHHHNHNHQHPTTTNFSNRQLQPIDTCEDLQQLIVNVPAFIFNNDGGGGGGGGCTCTLDDDNTFFSSCQGCPIEDVMTNYTAYYGIEIQYFGFDRNFLTFSFARVTSSYKYTSGQFSGIEVKVFTELDDVGNIIDCGLSQNGNEICTCNIDGEGFQQETFPLICDDDEEILISSPDNVLYAYFGEDSFQPSLQEICFGEEFTSPPIIIPAPSPPAPAPPVPSPPSFGKFPADCQGTIPCDTAIFIADLNQDNLMNQFEYVIYLTVISGNKFEGLTFNQLPFIAIVTFNLYARTDSPDGQIDIDGSKPGQTPTPAQDLFLGAFCCDTYRAIQEGPGEVICAEFFEDCETNDDCCVDGICEARFQDKSKICVSQFIRQRAKVSVGGANRGGAAGQVKGGGAP